MIETCGHDLGPKDCVLLIESVLRCSGCWKAMVDEYKHDEARRTARAEPGEEEE